MNVEYPSLAIRSFIVLCSPDPIPQSLQQNTFCNLPCPSAPTSCEFHRSPSSLSLHCPPHPDLQLFPSQLQQTSPANQQGMPENQVGCTQTFSSFPVLPDSIPQSHATFCSRKPHGSLSPAHISCGSHRCSRVTVLSTCCFVLDHNQSRYLSPAKPKAAPHRATHKLNADPHVSTAPEIQFLPPNPYPRLIPNFLAGNTLWSPFLN